jgi:biotin synthase
VATSAVLDGLVHVALRRERPSRADLLAVLDDEGDLLDVVVAAGVVRRTFFGRRVKLNYLVNLKSGLCPEDCSYCSQRLGATSDVLKYTWLKPDAAVDAACAGVAGGARRVCLVASGRGPSDHDVDRVGTIIAAIKDKHPTVEVCACLGLLGEQQGERLLDAGADAYNHNLNTSESRYADICSTHTFDDRVATVRTASGAGLSPCSGMIVGMGETDDEIVDLLFALRDLEPDSVPVNFLMPFEGTPLAGNWQLTPERCLRVLAAARFVFPDVEVRMAGGREMHLRSLQPLGLQIANSMFLGDYLTSEGQEASADLQMIADLGFEVEDMPAHGAPVTQTARREPVLRQRGAGTVVAPNA